MNRKVAAVFRAYPSALRSRLMFLRSLILDVASKTDGVGVLEETLRWGQPSYLTAGSGSGSLIRIDAVKSEPGAYAMYFHCQTSLVPTFRAMYPDTFRFDGNRGLVFRDGDHLPELELRHCIEMALTYHRDRKARAKLERKTRAGKRLSH